MTPAAGPNRHRDAPLAITAPRIVARGRSRQIEGCDYDKVQTMPRAVRLFPVPFHMRRLCRGHAAGAGYMTTIRDAARWNGRIRPVLTRRMKGSTSPVTRRQIAGNTGSA